VTETFLIGCPSESISGSKLPTNRQAFQYFLHLKNSPEYSGQAHDNQFFAYETIDAGMPFWHMARIKTMTRQNAMLHFMSLKDKHRKLAKNKGREGDPGGRRKEFELELDKLFDIGSPDAILEIKKNRLLSKEKIEEDIRFYRDQQTERLGCMSGHDKVFESKSCRQSERRQKEQLRKNAQENETLDTDVLTSLTTDDEDDDYRSNDSTVSEYQPIPQSSDKETTVLLKFPRKIMESEEICNAADRLCLTDNQTTAIVSAVLRAGGGDLDDFTISRSSTRRNRMAVRYNLSQQQMANFRGNPPKFGALHWDGKLLKDILGSEPGQSNEKCFSHRACCWMT